MNIIGILSDNPILLLFTVASIGYFLGNIKIMGGGLGVAAVLFTGLLFGAIDPSLRIPETIFMLGLVLFVYSLGLSSGPAFFDSYKKNGIKDFIFIISMLLFSGVIAVVLFSAFGFSASMITGIYSGSTTNTPSLAGVIDHITTTYGDDSAALTNETVIGYSLSYPMGVIGSIISIVIMEKLMKIDYAKEQQTLRKTYPVEKFLTSAIVRVTQEKVHGHTWRDIMGHYKWDVIFSRIIKGDEQNLVKWDTVIHKNDLVMIIGSKDDVEAAMQDIGVRAKSNFEFDRTTYDVRRIFVSNPQVAGRSIASLNLDKKFNTVLSRIRRGDIDMLADEDTVLELGDRIRFIARRKDLRALSEFFGDSYADSSKVDLFTFGLGIGIGLILGSIQIPLGPGFTFKLGYAGGPLIIGLLLGALRRTGPIVWTLPYSANVTLQQIGLILLLASIGVNSGNSFITSLSADSVWIILCGTIITILTGCSILFIGFKIVKLPFSLLLGIVSNQPAILDFAKSRSGTRIPEFGYTMMFPIASIMKIVIAQIMFILLASG